MTAGTTRVEVGPERMAGWLDRFRRRHGDLAVAAGPDGLVVTAPDGAYAVLAAPWPGAEPPAGVDALLAHAGRTRVVGLLLVRRGGFAVGVAEGDRLLDSKVGRRHVQGRTKAGGWSQQRYARRREAQAAEAFGAAADTAVRVLLPHRSRLEGLVPGGDRAAVSAVLDDARLRGLRDLPQGRFLDVPDPRLRVLEQAVRRARSVVVDVHDPLRG